MDRFDLLEMLRARRGTWCPLAAVAKHLFASLREVKTAADELREQGYIIDEDPVGNLRFAGTADRLLPYEITRDLGTQIIGREVVSLEETASTNDEVWERLAQGASEGLVVLAEHQTEGRGRLGRRWLAPPRNAVMMSILLTPGLDPRRLSSLTTMAAVGVAQALQETHRVPALIRWPNDIILHGRKLGGILVEARQHKETAAFVLGIGLNLNLTREQMPAELSAIATSLRIETGQPVDRVATARQVLRSLDRWYGELAAGRHRLISDHWRQYSSSLGNRITVLENGRRYTGRVLDISLDDGLILQLDRGVTRVFDGAQVTVVKEV